MARKKGEPEATLPSLPSADGIRLLRKQIDAIPEHIALWHDDPKIARWENYTEDIIIRSFGKPSTQFNAYWRIDKYQGLRFGIRYAPSEAEFQAAFKSTMEQRKELMEGFVEQLQDSAGSSIGNVEVADSPTSNDVFIVHGHNHSAKTELARILEHLKLQPIILHEKPNSGRTLIEKLELHSDVGYCFVLLTPDDEGRERSSSEPLKPRARQNVVFEFGRFVGSLSRFRVCCLYSGDVELPSDLSGIARIQFRESVNEVGTGIVRELRAAGYDVSADDLP
jgi:predicted nucleotide-binding protein